MMKSAKVNMCLSVFLLPFFSEFLFGVEFHNEYNHYSGNEIKKFKVCGERCSGTNFLSALVDSNFLELENTLAYGHKHFLWWFNNPQDAKKLSSLKYSLREVNMEGSEDVLFIVVVRSPLDWLRSFYLQPYYVEEKLLSQGFFHFISSEWRLTQNNYKKSPNWDQIDNYNPTTGRPFSNILQLRRAKTLNYLFLGNIVDNYLFVRYEDVRDHPDDFIDFVANYYNLTHKKKFVPIDLYKGYRKPYFKKKYFSVEEEDLDFINSQLDWELENRIGFFKE